MWAIVVRYTNGQVEYLRKKVKNLTSDDIVVSSGMDETQCQHSLGQLREEVDEHIDDDDYPSRRIHKFAP